MDRYKFRDTQVYLFVGKKKEKLLQMTSLKNACPGPPSFSSNVFLKKNI